MEFFIDTGDIEEIKESATRELLMVSLRIQVLLLKLEDHKRMSLKIS